MGSRNLIEVKLDGELKIAQYGQWNGHPTGQGIGIADFLHKGMNKKKFKQALRECRFMDEKEREAFFTEKAEEDIIAGHPWLLRDAGSDVLRHVQNDGARLLWDRRDFKNDQVMCEYHYLIDMDNETVSVNGSNPIPFTEWTRERMTPLEEGERIRRRSIRQA
jgi:hypothetical protein